jgi:tetratricopeptide (TPR) repeat protein
VPDYLPRELDGDLDDAVARALDGSGRWIIVAVGSSKVGKSRALFEVFRRQAAKRDIQFVAPVDCSALEALLDPGELTELHARPNVLWLDDLEPFVEQGLTMQILRRWHERFAPCVVAATCGGKALGGPSSGDLGTIAGKIRQRAHEVYLEATNENEIEPLRSHLQPEVLAAIERHGLGAYVIAGSNLQAKLTMRRHKTGDPECPEGVAIVYAAVDWVRAGRNDLIPDAKLRELWREYVLPGTHLTDDGFEVGLKWALDPVAGSIALLEDRGGAYRAYDYVIGLVAERPEAEVHRDSIWGHVLNEATDSQAFSIGVMAFLRHSFENAAASFRVASASHTELLAGFAILNRGITLGELNRSEEEIAAYDELLARFGEAEEPELREPLARALFSKGVTLGELDRFEEEIAAYDELLARFGEAEEPELRPVAAMALFNRAVRLGALGRFEEEIAAYDELLARFGEAEEPKVRERVAVTLYNEGARLGTLGRFEEAIAAYDELLARFGEAEEPELRERVATTLYNKGVTLRELNRSEEEIAAYDELLARFGEAEEPKVREWVAAALADKGATFAELNRFEEAIAAYDELLARFGEAEEPELREPLARAVFNKGVTLGELNRFEEAIAAYDELLARFGEAEEPKVREVVESAKRELANKG